MFISKRKVIEVLADNMAHCDKNIIRGIEVGMENLTDFEREFCRNQQKISFILIDISLALRIYKEVIRKKNKIIEYWEKHEFDKELEEIRKRVGGIDD